MNTASTCLQVPNHRFEWRRGPLRNSPGWNTRRLRPDSRRRLRLIKLILINYFFKLKRSNRSNSSATAPPPAPGPDSTRRVDCTVPKPLTRETDPAAHCPPFETFHDRETVDANPFQSSRANLPDTASSPNRQTWPVYHRPWFGRVSPALSVYPRHYWVKIGKKLNFLKVVYLKAIHARPRIESGMPFRARYFMRW